MSGFGGPPPGLSFGFSGTPAGAPAQITGFGFNSVTAGSSQPFGSPATFEGLQPSSGLARPPGLAFGTPAQSVSPPAQGFGSGQSPTFGGLQGSGGGFQGFGMQQNAGAPATLFGSSPNGGTLPAPSSGFGQASGFSSGFGAQAGLGVASTTSGFGQPATGFGQQQPAATVFGQQQAAGTVLGQQQPATTFSNFSQPAVSGFGRSQPASGFGQAPSTSGFGQQPTSPPPNLGFGPAATVQPPSSFGGNLSAGSAAKMQFGQPVAVPGFMSQPSSQLEAAPKTTFGTWGAASQAPKLSQRAAKAAAPSAEEVSDGNMSMEEMRKKALASMPSFIGSGGGGGGGDASLSFGNGTSAINASAPSVPRKQLSARLQGGGIARVAPQDQQALQRRSARFGAPPAQQQPPLPTEDGDMGGSQPLGGRGGGGGGSVSNGGDGGEGRGNGDPVVGTCTLMCPVKERNARETSGNIRFFERPDPAVNMSSPELAVKTFARTGIDELGASDFRTRAALKETMVHLRGIMDLPSNKARIHNFLFDRYRSVRQDLYVQGLQDDMAMNMYEETVRYHVLCEHELCSENAGAGDADGFSSPLNREQCNKALISLQEMYESAVRRGCPRPPAIEAEFRAYHMLMLLNEHGRLKSAKLQIVSSLQEMRPEVLAAYHTQQAIALHNALEGGNYAGFFQLVRRLPYLMACLSHRFFPAMWEHALETLANSLHQKQWYPLAQLENVLLLDSTDYAESLCREYGLHVGPMPGSGDLGVYFDSNQLAFSRLAGGALVQLRSSAVIALKGGVPTSSNVIHQVGNAEDEGARIAAAAQLEVIRAEGAAQQGLLMQAGAAAAPSEAALAQQGQLMQQQRQQQQRQQQVAEAAAAQQEAAKQAQLAQHAAAQQAAVEHAAEAERQLQAERDLRAARAAAQQQARRDEEQRQSSAAAAAAAEAAALRRQQELQQVEDQRRREDEHRRQVAEHTERRRAAEQRAAQASHARQLAEQERIRQAANAKRERAEEDRLVVQLRSRFLVRVWRLSARRQRDERALARIAACSTAGSLRRSPAGKPAPAALTSAMVLKRPLVDSPVSEPQQKRKRPAAQQWRRADVASAMAPGLAARSPGAPELFAKLLLLQSGADDGQEPLLMHWLRAKMAGPPGAPTTGPFPRGHNVVAAYAEDLQLRNAKATSIRICVRETRSTAPEQASEGATGIIFLIPEVSRPVDMAAHLRAAAIAAPQGVMLPLLLVTARASEAVRQQLQHAAEEAVGDDLDSPFRGVTVVSLAAVSAVEKGPFSQKSLLGGLQWLSQWAPREPRVEVRSLQSLLEGEVQRQLLPVRMDWAAIPADYLAAYNTALVAVSQRIRMSSSSAVGRWGWPAPELSCGATEHTAPPAALWVPSGWADPQHSGALTSTVQKLALPPPLDHLMTAEDVAEYLHSIGSDNTTEGDWRGMLEAAFSTRLATLRHSSDLPPAVLLPDEQPHPSLQTPAVQAKQAALLVSALRLQPAAPSFLVASKRHISAAFSGLTSGWLRPRQADPAPAPSPTSQPIPKGHSGEQALVVAEPEIAVRPEGLLAGRLTSPAPSGGLMELMAIFEEEQASLCALDRRLMTSLRG